jgi:hypothetical protein
VKNLYYIDIPQGPKRGSLMFSAHRQIIQDCGIPDMDITWKGWVPEYETWQVNCTESQLLILLLKTDAKLHPDFKDEDI